MRGVSAIPWTKICKIGKGTMDGIAKNKNNTTKLSVIMPIYNKAAYVGESLTGILLQSLCDIELICIDDGSTDGSAEIIADFAGKDSRVRLIRQSNHGAGVARNVGIKAAKGEYIAFLDADDFYPTNNILARLYAAAKANNADICGGSFCEVDGDKLVSSFTGNMAGNTFAQEGWIDFHDYQFDYAYYRFIYRREFLLSNQLFFPDYRRYQDPPFMLRAFAAAGKFYAIPDVTYCYRINYCPVDWTVEKVYGLLCGIEDNLTFSAQHKFDKVHVLNYLRLCKDFYRPIVDTAMQYDADGKILKKLVDVQSVVNKQMLSESGRFTEEEISCSKPLSELIESLSRQNAQIKREGWFINKKLFRVYTLPIRTIGKIIKTIKK